MENAVNFIKLFKRHRKNVLEVCIVFGILIGFTIAGGLAIEYQLDRKHEFETNVYKTLSDYLEVDNDKIYFEWTYTHEVLEEPLKENVYKFIVKANKKTYIVTFNDNGKEIDKIKEIESKS